MNDVSAAPASERDLVVRARGGDPDAFTELVRHHQRRAFRAAYLLSGSASDAEDALQEAFVRAWRALDRFHEDAPFAPWLLTIVARQVATQQRATGRRNAWALRATRDDRWVPAAVDAPTEAAILALERQTALRQALSALPPHQRRVVELRYLAELSEQETAAALGCRPGTVKSRLSRALSALQKQMKEPT
ncbi:MAG: polymerase sigma factor [Conexibacter sp.]|nr:polymerase sigma factor [Conexibacter sp.]